MDKFAKTWGVTIFNLGLGYMLLGATELPNWAMWMISIPLVLLGILAVAQFGQVASFWNTAKQSPDEFGPKGEHHEYGKAMFDRTVMLSYDFQTQEKFWFSLGCSIFLMAGLYHQGWHVALAAEFAATVLGYAVIRAFLTHFPYYYSLINGKDLSNVKI